MSILSILSKLLLLSTVYSHLLLPQITQISQIFFSLFLDALLLRKARYRLTQIFNLMVDRTQHAVSLLFCGWQFDSEGGAESEFGAFNEDFAVMVLFDNAFGERESESPTTLFGGVARLEDGFEFVALDATT